MPVNQYKCNFKLLKCKLMRNWDDIRHFLAIVRLGSLQAASVELNVDQSTVFRRLRSLEDYLGSHVFERRRRGRYELTPAGEALLAQARQIEEAMHSIDHRVRGKDLQLSGCIRVATSEDIAVSLLPRHLEAFERNYPEITIELLTANRYYSLTRNEADVAIRPGFSTEEERIVSRRICPAYMGLFASSSYLDRYGTPQMRSELVNHHIIEWRDDLARESFSSEIESCFSPSNRHGSNSLLSIRALAAEGLGVALLPECLGFDEARLKRVLPELRVGSDSFWLLHHSEIRHFARIRVFNDFICKSLSTDPRIVPATSSDLNIPNQGSEV